jgi:hypothetical protein
LLPLLLRVKRQAARGRLLPAAEFQKQAFTMFPKNEQSNH